MGRYLDGEVFVRWLLRRRVVGAFGALTYSSVTVGSQYTNRPPGIRYFAEKSIKSTRT